MLSDSPYDLLLHSTGPESRILWCWFPRSERWTEYELIERSTRAIAAVRNDDLVALPALHAVRSHASHWCDSHDLCSSQILWYDPMLHPSGFAACLDPAHAALLTVLNQVPASLSMRPICLYHMYLGQRVLETAGLFGINCLGDPEEHPMIGSLSKAKMFLHPNVDIHPGIGFPIQLRLKPSMRDADLGDDVIVPRGFTCYTADQLREAWSNLKSQDPAMRLVLKPAGGSGGEGVVINVMEAEVHRVAWLLPQVYRDGLAATILEEMIGEPGGASPTVYLVGTTPFAIADQLLVDNGAVNAGNVMPAVLVDPATQQTMLRAASALGAHLGLTGQWGLDFALRAGDGAPVMCDLNCGRPNGSLSYYCWRSRQPRPRSMVGFEEDGVFLALTCFSWDTPKTLTLGAFVEDLEARRLLWDAQRGDGIVVAQHLPGKPSSVLVASWKGSSAVKELLGAFRRIYTSPSPSLPDTSATAAPKVAATSSAVTAVAAAVTTAAVVAAAAAFDPAPVVMSVAATAALAAAAAVTVTDVPPPVLTTVGVVAAVPVVAVAAAIVAGVAPLGSSVASAAAALCSIELVASAAPTGVTPKAALVALASAAIERPFKKPRAAGPWE